MCAPSRGDTKPPDSLPWALILPLETAAEFSSGCLTLFTDRSAHLLDTEVAGGTILPIFHLNEMIFCKEKKKEREAHR